MEEMEEVRGRDGIDKVSTTPLGMNSHCIGKETLPLNPPLVDTPYCPPKPQ